MGLDFVWVGFIAVGVVGVIVALFFWVGAGDKKRGNIFELRRLVGLPEYVEMLKKWKQGLIAIIVVLSIVIIGFIVVVSKPVTITEVTPTKHNRDIVLCLDASGSMFQVNSDALVRFRELVDEFQGERISLVVWNNSSNLVFPLTDDYEYVVEQLDYVANGFEDELFYGTETGGYDFSRYTINNEGGSLVGDGLTACSLSLNDDAGADEDRSKSIILITDNVVGGEQLIPFPEAVEYVTREGITIYGIRPTTGWEVGGEENEMRTLIEEVNGGKFYPLNDSAATGGVVESINATSEGTIVGEATIVKVDTPQWWILGGVAGLMLVLGVMLRLKV